LQARVGALEALEAYRRGSSVAKAVEQALAAIQAWEPRVNAFITVEDRERLLEAAARAEEAYRQGSPRPLEGVVVAVKDNISTSWLPTTAGSRFLESYTPPYNAFVVDRLLEAGAIIVGKTNMDEFAMGSTGENSAFGPTRNPWDLERVPGGSSSGSGAVLAYGGAHLALGSDTGGSVRLPAAWTLTVALKPTYGAVSRRGLIPYANSLEQIGPMGRSVRDVALLYSVIAGPDPLDATSIDYRPPDPWRLEPAEPRRLRLCLAEDVLEASDPLVAGRVEDVLAGLERLGVGVERVRLGFTSYVLPTYYTIAMAEAASNLARYDGVLYPCRGVEAPGWERLVVESREACLGREVKRRILMGVFVLSEGYRDEYYMMAARARRLIRDRLLELTSKCLVVTPTATVLPPRLGEKTGDPTAMYMLDVATVTANLAGVPALSLPAGLARGLPVGLQLMGPPMGEELLFRAGLLVEEVTGLAGVVAG